MKFPSRERASSISIVVALAGVLAVLAILQYRWSREVSEAASERMKSNLQTAMTSMRWDLSRELAGIGLSLQPDATRDPAGEAAEFAKNLSEWSHSSPHAAVVRAVYLVQDAGTARAHVSRLDTTAGSWQADGWPQELEQLRDPLQSFSSDIVAFGPRHDPPPDRTPVGQHGPFGRRMRSMWHVDPAAPALLHFQRTSPIKNGDASISWLIITLDPALLREHMLPELAERYFGGSQGLLYDVAVISRGDQPSVFYASNPQLGTTNNLVVDAAVPLFGPGGGAGPHVFNEGGHLPANAAAPTRPVTQQRTAHEPVAGPVRLDPLPFRAQNSDWQLVVKHRKGSLEAAVASLYHRNLAISFGILGVLAATMGIIVITTRRAQKLARLQMEFVAAVSHELRTPLAVINSAADNIAEGIVGDKQRLSRYGRVIRNQARQLSQLVEQILLFAATHEGVHRFQLQPVAPADVVHTALSNTEELATNAGFTVNTSIQPELPLVQGDVLALSQCVQNLITNAIKYSGESRWIGVRAFVETKHDVKHVCISVADNGVGIAREELRRIFDPFYRSSYATSTQIRGTGLGLSLARTIAEMMGGSIMVSSEPGKGSMFTLQLPALAPTDAPTLRSTTDEPADTVAQEKHAPEAAPSSTVAQS
jgi:two-component system, OmpR family, sensor histidine kinase SenX3